MKKYKVYLRNSQIVQFSGNFEVQTDGEGFNRFKDGDTEYVFNLSDIVYYAIQEAAEQ